MRDAPPTFKTHDPIDTMPPSSFSSSNVHSALYDFGATNLYVRYLRDGVDAIYRYSNVPASTWQGLIDASSKGSYINESIAYSFRYEQITISEFPQQGRGVGHPLARRFLTAPISTRETAAHPHISNA